eukprot:5359072-Pleurochrysis_carterae.AAC.1
MAPESATPVCFSARRYIGHIWREVDVKARNDRIEYEVRSKLNPIRSQLDSARKAVVDWKRKYASLETELGRKRRFADSKEALVAPLAKLEQDSFELGQARARERQERSARNRAETALSTVRAELHAAIEDAANLRRRVLALEAVATAATRSRDQWSA